MKRARDHHFVENWKIFVSSSLACLAILQTSEVVAATLNIVSPSLSNVTSPTTAAVPARTTPSKTSTTTTEAPVVHVDQPEGIEERIPNRILGEILYLDNLKCFPKLLCTIYQDDAITRQGFFVNATELGLAYIKLIKAVHYAPKTTTTTAAPTKRMRPIIQIFKIPLGLITASTSTNQGRKDSLHRSHHHHHQHHRLQEDDDEYEDHGQHYEEDYPHHSRSPLRFDEDDEEDDNHNLYRRNREEEENREYLREKLEISQMMKELTDEDKAEMMNREEEFESPGKAGLATTLLQSYLPFIGSRSMKDGRSVLIADPKTRDSHRVPRKRSKKSKDPFWKAVNMWRKLKRRSQCERMYKTCPFQAWEIVRMLDLVRGQSKVLATYLKITVDKVKPKRKRQ